MFRILGAGFLLILSGTPDLDVGVPFGSPLDYIRIPVSTPPTLRPDVATGSAGSTPTKVETQVDRFPRRPLPLSSPLTLDFEAHLNWKPAEGPKGTPTGAALQGYPPPYPNELYIHCISFYLMLMLHEDQVSPREILCYLTEIGEPAAHAGTAVRSEQALRQYAEYVISAAGGVPAFPPRPSKLKFENDLLRELAVDFVYEDQFGTEFLKLPGRTALPALLPMAQSKAHAFVARNATYALRLYDETEVVPVLRTLVKSSDKVIRNRALAALIRWQDPDTVPWLIDQLDSTDVPFRAYALHALGLMGDRRAVDAILKHAKIYSSDWEFLWGALAALARLRDSKEEVTKYLARVQGILGAMRLPDARRKILEERVRIASAYLGDKTDQRWIRTVIAQNANKNLVQEFKDFELAQEMLARAPKPAPAPAPAPVKAPEPKPAAPEPAPAPAPKPPSAAELALAKYRDRLLEYSGVRAVTSQDQSLVLDVATEADADDLRILLGASIHDVRLEIRIP